MVKTRFPFFGNCWEEDDTFGRKMAFLGGNLLGLGRKL